MSTQLKLLDLADYLEKKGDTQGLLLLAIAMTEVVAEKRDMLGKLQELVLKSKQLMEDRRAEQRMSPSAEVGVVKTDP